MVFSNPSACPVEPKRHDRYRIYGLIGRRVVFDSPIKRARIPVTGVIEDVCRDIFDNVVEVMLRGGRVFRFPEPTAMVGDRGGAVVFVYGDAGRKAQTDAAMFKELRSSRMGEHVDDILKRTAVEKIRRMRFVPVKE